MSQEQPHQEEPETQRQYWFIELWTENRELFKELIKHVLIFGIFIGSIIGFHEILTRSTLPNDERELLNKVHFYMYLVALVIFAGSFIIKG